jgi:hypothetical protein
LRTEFFGRGRDAQERAPSTAACCTLTTTSSISVRASSTRRRRLDERPRATDLPAAGLAPLKTGASAYRGQRVERQPRRDREYPQRTDGRSRSPAAEVARGSAAALPRLPPNWIANAICASVGPWHGSGSRHFRHRELIDPRFCRIGPNSRSV